ncbi:winged helix-turn-helix domain-containing protein [Achromobacter xylosoxidans]|uniref:winged helix-turn-helix domain-containing protein n=1 Tax=Achromobacter TaxID=222 RepID=UPI0001F4392E|nr:MULTISPECIES: winged helix-turn-helix domain-containing protein [Achromobacter]AUZ18693.1 winged helix family transcriptional regulator [Achromobacter xylosoxidans]EFV86843.1 transcriptional regulator [Achromobacter xylosoxidans C54]MCH1995191.1 winged helix-turn-helix domain-containing protein [Achromobacter xylosoxidans]MCH4592443.1 winged helix-turn-helix domain-containing protein [Achromobacter xylosoxidans]MCM2574822.1 winged helix-turn-helix domain-containing protein [Achromobacter xy
MTAPFSHSPLRVPPAAPSPDAGREGSSNDAAAASDAFPVRLDGWWSLLYHGWTLLTPQGTRLDLTEVERACFQCLLRNPRKELLREELAVLREELMLPRQSTNLRALNVAICRLRRKVRQAGGRLPLHTVHGVGYVFLGNLQEVADL